MWPRSFPSCSPQLPEIIHMQLPARERSATRHRIALVPSGMIVISEILTLAFESELNIGAQLLVAIMIACLMLAFLVQQCYPPLLYFALAHEAAAYSLY